MGIFDKLRNEFIDIIEWVDNTTDTIIWKFPRYQNEIKMGAKLVVRESQQAVFLNEGTIADVYKPGTYTLETQNMPILTTLKGWKYGFNSPFKADVFYVSTKQFLNLKWGTQNPITLTDERFGMIEMRAFGSYSFQINDAGKFIKEVAGTNTEFTTESIAGQLRSILINKFTDMLAESGITIDKVASNLEEISKLGIEKMNPDFNDYGITLTKFLVENISMPEELKKEIFEYSRLDKINMQKLAQMKAAKSIEIAAANEGGVAGIGAGIAAGMGVGNVMSNALNQQQNNGGGNTMPPPLTQYYFAINGERKGPFSQDQLPALVQSGEVKQDTMVWKTGMADWAKASTVADFASVLTSVPPPPPPPAI